MSVIEEYRRRAREKKAEQAAGGGSVGTLPQPDRGSVGTVPQAPTGLFVPPLPEDVQGLRMGDAVPTMAGSVGTVPQAAPDPWAEYERRTARSADLFGIQRSEGVPDPGAREQFLRRQGRNLGIAPGERRRALEELAGVEAEKMAQANQRRTLERMAAVPVPEPEMTVLKPGERGFVGGRMAAEGAAVPEPELDPSKRYVKTDRGMMDATTGQIVPGTEPKQGPVVAGNVIAVPDPNAGLGYQFIAPPQGDITVPEGAMVVRGGQTLARNPKDEKLGYESLNIGELSRMLNDLGTYDKSPETAQRRNEILDAMDKKLLRGKYASGASAGGQGGDTATGGGARRWKPDGK